MGERIARLLLVAGMVCVAACAGGSAPRGGAGPKPPATKAALRASTSGTYPPLSVWKDGRPEGFAPALLEAFAAADHTEVSWSRFKWPDLVRDMRAGRFDIAADGLTIMAERSIAGRFTVPIAQGSSVLLLRRPDWAKPLKKSAEDPRETARAIDRPELRIVVGGGGHLERVARSVFRAATIHVVRGPETLRELLLRGDVDGAMSDTFDVLRRSEGIPDVERIGPLGRETIAFLVHPDREDLAERLDAWLLAQEERGSLDEVRTMLIGPGGGAASAHPVGALLAATVERLALMPLVAAARREQKKPRVDSAEDEAAIAAGREAVAKAAAAIGIAPPPEALVDAFFRAQTDAGNLVATSDVAPSTTQKYSLESDLRPALARITKRMAFLLARMPRKVGRDAVLAEAREQLDASGLDAASVDRIGSAIVALGED